MENRRSTFLLDEAKLKEQQEKNGISDSALSMNIGKSRTWLSKVKKNGLRVKISDVQALAEKLACSIQDLGENLEGRRWNPVGFHYEEEAIDRLNKMLPQDAELIARTLRFLQGASQEQKDDLAVYISDSKWMAKRSEIPACDQWWKVLYISSLSEVLVQKLDVCSENDLFDRYKVSYRKALKKEKERQREKLENEKEEIRKELIEKGKSEGKADKAIEERAKAIDEYVLNIPQRYAVMAGIIENSINVKIWDLMDDAAVEEAVLKRVTATLKEMFSVPLQEAINDRGNRKILEEACVAPAEFLVSYFESPATNYRPRINQFKRGIF